MKRSVVIVLILLFSLAGFAWAETSEFYVKTVPISKVYVHSLGYRIVYQKADKNFAVFYVPNDWFQPKPNEAPKAELVTEVSRAVPYFSIFYKNGQFDHIRLYLHRNPGDISYGDLENPDQVDDNFDVETLDLEF